MRTRSVLLAVRGSDAMASSSGFSDRFEGMLMRHRRCRREQGSASRRSTTMIGALVWPCDAHEDSHPISLRISFTIVLTT